MSNVELKEAARLFWIMKGHLTDEDTMKESYNGYFRRLWGNNENFVHEEGFEEAFLERQQSKKKL